jgi:hypothetical protein
MDWDCYEQSRPLLIIHIRIRTLMTIIATTRNPHHSWQVFHFEPTIITMDRTVEHLVQTHRHLVSTRRKRTSNRTILLVLHSPFGSSLPFCVVFPMVSACDICLAIVCVCLCPSARSHSFSHLLTHHTHTHHHSQTNFTIIMKHSTTYSSNWVPIPSILSSVESCYNSSRRSWD